MRNIFLLASGMLILSLCFLNAVKAAQIDLVTTTHGIWTASREETPICNIYLHGPIVKGDADSLRSFIKSVGAAPYLSNATLCLNSNGGDYDEGLAISRLVIENSLDTMVGPNASCFSACALIFMAGGYYEEGAHLPYRKLHITGRLGFHAPYIKAADRQYDANAVNMSYFRAIAAIRDLARLGKEFHIQEDLMPSSLFVELISKGPDEVFLIDTVYKVIRTNIFLYGGSRPQRVTKDMLGNICMNNFIPAQNPELDNPPPGWDGNLQLISKLKPTEFEFVGLGSEGSFSCVVEYPGRFGALAGFYPSLTAKASQIELSDLSPVPFWYLYPPNTNIRDLR